jgi:hypothetical protein
MAPLLSILLFGLISTTRAYAPVDEGNVCRMIRLDETTLAVPTGGKYVLSMT